MNSKEKLFEQFSPVTAEEWMSRISDDLKGSDFSERMIWKTREGIDLLPFYRKEDVDNLRIIDSLPGMFPYVRGGKIHNNSWKIRQNIDVTDYSRANGKAIRILNNGIDSLGFYFEDVRSVNERNFKILLEGIFPESVELNFLSNGMAKEIVGYFLDFVSRSGSDPVKVSGAIETDPLSRLMLNGTLCIPVVKGFDYLADVATLTSPVRGFRALHINASNFRGAGSDIVQELAFAISMGVEYMDQLTSRKISTETAASKMRFSFGTGPEYFLEIAKLRAARLLWSVILKNYNLEDREIRMEIHSVTGRWNKTLFDPFVNMLRTQTEAMSAIIGGTDSLTVEPYDIIFRSPDEFSERIARNQQLILKDESYFDKVADPSAGSYYVENLTHLLSDSAWNLFLEIEEEGGFLEALHKGIIQSKINESARSRAEEIEKRKILFTGTNHYPDFLEKIPDRTDPSRLFSMKNVPPVSEVESLKIYRGSEELEKIRMDVLQSEKRPVVYLLKTGDPFWRKARAEFSREFFGCAGYEVLESPDFDNVEQGIDNALFSSSDIIVTCCSDAEYEAIIPVVLDRIGSGQILVVAGNPVSAENLRSLGVEYFIGRHSGVAGILRSLNEKMGLTL